MDSSASSLGRECGGADLTRVMYSSMLSSSTTKLFLSHSVQPPGRKRVDCHAVQQEYDSRSARPCCPLVLPTTVSHCIAGRRLPRHHRLAVQHLFAYSNTRYLCIVTTQQDASHAFTRRARTWQRKDSVEQARGNQLEGITPRVVLEATDDNNRPAADVGR